MVLNSNCTITRLVSFIANAEISRLIFSSLSAVLIANARILLCTPRAKPPVTSLLSGTEINFHACLLSSTSNPLAPSFSGALRHLEGDGTSYVSNALHCSPSFEFFHFTPPLQLAENTIPSKPLS